MPKLGYMEFNSWLNLCQAFLSLRLGFAIHLPHQREVILFGEAKNYAITSAMASGIARITSPATIGCPSVMKR